MFRKNTSYHDTITSVWLKPLHQHLVTLLWPSKSLYSRSVMFTHTNNFGSVFSNHLNCKIYETKFPTNIHFLLSICFVSYLSNFFFDPQNLTFIHD